MKGFEKKRSDLLESLRNMQRNGFALQQMLFIHSGGEQSSFTKGALVVTNSSYPDFFNKVGTGIWEFLDSVRRDFQ